MNSVQMLYGLWDGYGLGTIIVKRKGRYEYRVVMFVPDKEAQHE